MSDLTPAGTPVPPAVPTAPEAGAATVVEVAPRKSKGLGIFAMILGLLAFLGDLVIVIVTVVQVVGVVANFDVSNIFSTGGLAALGTFLALLFIAFWGGIVVSGLAVLLGLIAAISGRGRAQGVVGLVFGLLVLLSHLIVGASLLGIGNGIGNIGS
jgi:hypothetical protein